MAQNPTSRKRLALAIIDFLNTSVTDGTVPSDESESIEIAANCIAEAFKVDPTDKAAVSDALGGQSLLSIYSVYEKLKGKSTASAAAGTSPASRAESSTTSTTAAAAAAAGAGMAEAQGESDEAIKKKADAL